MFAAILFGELVILAVSYPILVFLWAGWTSVQPLRWDPYRSFLKDARVDLPFIFSMWFWYGMIVLILNASAWMWVG